MRKKLKEKRIEKNLLQRDICKPLGIARNSYTQIETGYRNPSFELSKKIKKILDYQNDDLFDNE